MSLYCSMGNSPHKRFFYCSSPLSLHLFRSLLQYPFLFHQSAITKPAIHCHASTPCASQLDSEAAGDSMDRLQLVICDGGIEYRVWRGACQNRTFELSTSDTKLHLNLRNVWLYSPFQDEQPKPWTSLEPPLELWGWSSPDYAIN